MRPVLLLIISLSLCPLTLRAQSKTLADRDHGISALIPEKWTEVQAERDETILKLSRSDGAARRAVMTLSIDNIPEDHVAPARDIWAVSDSGLRKKAAGGTFLGEPVTVIDVGRAKVDSIHFVWNKTRRQIPGSELWEFVYEGVVGSLYITVRLSSFGDHDWFTVNQSMFESFVQSLRFKAKRDPNAPSMQPPLKEVRL